MKKLTLILMLFLFLNPSFSQQSLDSLRLVLPVFHSDALGSNEWTPLFVEVSENEKFILSSDEMTTTILIWDYKSSKLVKEIEGATNPKFVGDEIILYYNEENSQIQFYNFIQDRIVKFYNDISEDSFYLTKKFCIISDENNFRIYDNKSHELVREISVSFLDSISKSQSSSYKIFCSSNDIIVLTNTLSVLTYDIENNIIKTEISFLSLTENDEISFHPYNSNLLLLKTKNKLSVFDISTHKTIKEYKLKKGERIYLSKDMNYVIKTEDFQKLRCINLLNNRNYVIKIGFELMRVNVAVVDEVRFIDFVFNEEKEQLITFDMGEFGIKYWDLRNGKLLKKIKTDGTIFAEIKKLKNNKVITNATYMIPISIRNLESGYVDKLLFGKTVADFSIDLHENNKFALSSSDSMSYVYNLNLVLKQGFTFEEKNRNYGDTTGLYSLQKSILSKSESCPVKIQKASGKYSRLTLSNSIDNNYNLILTSDDEANKLIYNKQTDAFLTYNWVINELVQLNPLKCEIRKKILPQELVNELYNSNVSISFISDKNLVLFEKRVFFDENDGDSSIFIIGIDTDYYFKYNNNRPLEDAIISKDGNFLIIKNFNGAIDVLSLKSKSKIYSLFQLENNNWLVKLPNSPYYMCSKDASKMLHYVTPSLKVIGFEQLDPVYNRPDIVLDSIGKYFGNSDGGMIEEYRKSWEKRIDHMGLDKEKLGKGEISVPNAEIVGADAIAPENKNGKLDIKVAANDPKYPLRRFNVYVNEVPLYGSAGISIAHLKTQVWETTVSVPLSIGENKIQVSVMNELGLENFKYPSYVRFVPQADNNIPGKTYFIGIGVDKFKDTCYNLNYCVKDVTDLSEAIGKDQKNVQAILLTNKMVTRESILKLKEVLQKSNVNDKVIILCSSHGLLDSMKRFYLATEDIDFENPSERGIKYEELEALLDSIPARQKLLLLDACNSGENEIEQGVTLANKPKSNCEKNNGGKGKIISNVKNNNSDFMKMNELFVNVRNNAGSVIISAAGGQQSALEGEIVKIDGKSIKNGAFTYCVLEYLKMHEGDKEALTVIQLKKYVEKRVEEITNGDQKPTSRQETMEIDWGLR